MAIQFIPEDGSGIPEANSYLTVDELIDYADILGYDADELSPEYIERRLIRAAIILDSRYRGSFPGRRRNADQGLEWPRVNSKYIDGAAIQYDVIPKEVKQAITEIVFLMEGGSDLQPTIQARGDIRSERVRADVVEEEIHYRDKLDMTMDLFIKVEDALSRITNGQSDRYRLRIVRVGGDG